LFRSPTENNGSTFWDESCDVQNEIDVSVAEIDTVTSHRSEHSSYPSTYVDSADKLSSSTDTLSSKPVTSNIVTSSPRSEQSSHQPQAADSKDKLCSSADISSNKPVTTNVQSVSPQSEHLSYQVLVNLVDKSSSSTVTPFCNEVASASEAISHKSSSEIFTTWPNEEESLER